MNNEEQLQSFKNYMSLITKYKYAVDIIVSKLKVLDGDYKFKFNSSPIEHIESRIKSLEAILEKLERKGVEGTMDNVTSNIRDIGGVRVVCGFIDDVYTIFERLAKDPDIEIIRVKDYIKNPKENGYRTLHVNLTVPIYFVDKIEKVLIEVQIRTLVMDYWASLEHKLKYKNQADVETAIIEELSQCAKESNELDVKMNQLKNQIIRY